MGLLFDGQGRLLYLGISDPVRQAAGRQQERREIEDDTIRWENIECSWIGRNNVVKMTIPPKTIFTLNATTIKILINFS